MGLRVRGGHGVRNGNSDEVGGVCTGDMDGVMVCMSRNYSYLYADVYRVCTHGCVD